jgi:hypothetical protein
MSSSALNATPFYKLGDIPGFKNMLLKNPVENNLKFNRKNYSSKNNKYSIIHYDKEMLSLDIVPTVGLLRSVVIDSENSVVSFSPPKSIPFDTFAKKYPINNCEIVAEQFVEGIMINMFWDKTSGLSGSWEFATRNTVGGDVSFQKNQKTFRTMFLEAVEQNNLQLNMLNPAYCYSFVMQHPDNRIVVPFKTSQLYLVEVYEIVQTDDGTANVFSNNLEVVKKCGLWENTTVKFPEVYNNWSHYSDLKNEFASMNSSYDIMGVVIKNKKTLERCKLRNPVYEYIKNLHTNQIKIQYQYLMLRKERKISDFLKNYPENKKDFSFFREKLHDFTKTLYQNYITCYIKKEKLLKDFQDHFRSHMLHIHKLYIDELKPKNDYVNNSVVIQYVNNLHPSMQMYSLNACLRKRDIDFIKIDSTAD